MPQKIDILITGVGGQGVVLASDILGDAGVAEGYDVKKSDTLGMAQRGGSVVAHIRMGSSVASPLITKGETDLLLSLEKLETVRWADYLRTGAAVVYNDQAIPPLSVSRGEAVYPGDSQVALTVASCTNDFFAISGEFIAAGLGNLKVLNTIMLGALSMFLPFSPDTWNRVISNRVPGKAVDINLEAFRAGRKDVQRQLAEAARQAELDGIEEMHKHGDSCGC